MRRRPSITVLLSPGVPRPGDLLEVEARFESKSDTPLEKVTFELASVEKIVIQQGRSTSSWRHEHVRLAAEVPGRPLTPGLHSYRARFKLPVELPPQYWGRYGSIDHVLEVRAHIPWWPDRVGRYSVPVQQLPMNAPARPGVYVSEAGGPKGGEPYAEVSLASTTVEPGGEIEGTVAFTNGEKERGVRVALVAFERLFASAGFFQGGSIRETLEVRRWNHVLSNGPPEEGRGLPFRIAVAPDTVPSFTGKICALEWAVEVISERLLSSRTLLRVPVLIVPRTHAARRSSKAAVPAVGRERRAQSFQNVAARAGLSYNPDHDDLRGMAGSVGIRIAPETRPDGTLATVAHLSWPPLGMALRLGPSSWTHWLEGRLVEAGHPGFDRRFHVQSRFPAQARALLDAELCELVATFDEARADDEGATLAVSKVLVDEAPLGDLVTRAVKAARAFDAAFRRVPPPPALEPHAAAWQDFAARLGGRFEPGRGAILDATFGLERVEIATSWSEDGDPLNTAVRILLTTRVDPDAIVPAARALALSLHEQTGAHIAITADAVSASLPQLVSDPGSLEPLLEGLTRLAQAARGRGAAGPFRS